MRPGNIDGVHRTTVLRSDDLEYDLPPGLIATRPAEPRDSARLMVVSRTDPALLEHAHVRDLPRFLLAGDVMVRNASRVLPARLEGVRRDSAGRVGGLFLHEPAPGVWRVLLRSNGKLRPGVVIDLLDAHGVRGGVSLTLDARDEEAWLARPSLEGAASTPDAPALLARIGATPLPPYILRARRERSLDLDDDLDRAWYQTVYASDAHAGSVAAPTAGLHFTPGLLARLESMGVRGADLALHVGAGTFKPVESAHVEEHPIHSEWCEVPGDTLRAVDEARARGGRCVAIGTTSARALESVPEGHADAWRGETRLLITPGYEWKRVDTLLTNFHLPRSTLLAMVAALFPEPGGVQRLLALYATAVRERYRFYSYGDAMLILP
ncbi:MAG: tRNA preQ1(34) S-adenosylmethionine ribosyltransferase-isomerase QueA [Phycisphaerales bacterium]|nr:MAG: tRNA preQ1(34) S-adenosylmethionine ribosyltransferase-isomerase QueA [Phycisphaerales bacterium]